MIKVPGYEDMVSLGKMLDRRVGTDSMGQMASFCTVGILWRGESGMVIKVFDSALGNANSFSPTRKFQGKGGTH